jgi:hypothetical protein
MCVRNVGAGSRGHTPRQIGKEVAVPVQLQDGEELPILNAPVYDLRPNTLYEFRAPLVCRFIRKPFHREPRIN